MTFTYSLIADAGIVLVADTQVTYTHRNKIGETDGTYEGRRSKLRFIGKHSAFSVAGNGGLVDTLVGAAEQAGSLGEEFGPAIDAYRKAFLAVYNDKYAGRVNRLDATFLFCGYVQGAAGPKPQIIKLDMAGGFEYNPIYGSGWASSGSANHGAALYLHHRLYQDNLPLERAKFLAYLVAREVAEQDTSVGGSIEMVVITPKGANRVRNTKKYEAGRREFIKNQTGFFENFK
jgi:20S proteasome alpha/beta subunit